MRKIVLIQCVKRKHDTSMKACEIYDSALFKYMYKYAGMQEPDDISILSAKHYVLDTDEVIEPYDDTLLTKKSKEVKEWSEETIRQLREKYDLENDHFIILASDKYRKHLLEHINSYEIPLEGLGIGRQLGFLKKATESIAV